MYLSAEEQTQVEGIQEYVAEKSEQEEIEVNVEQPSEETTAVEETLDSGTRINEFGKIIRENNAGECVIQDFEVIKQVTQSKTSKQFEQIQQMQEVQTTSLWKNRFKNWYGALDRVSQNSKSKFLKMKAEIVKVISDKIKERTNGKENDRQDEQEK